jgi:hypothetical protein
VELALIKAVDFQNMMTLKDISVRMAISFMEWLCWFLFRTFDFKMVAAIAECCCCCCSWEKTWFCQSHFSRLLL